MTVAAVAAVSFSTATAAPTPAVDEAPSCQETGGMLEWTPFNGENDTYRILRNGRTVDRVNWDDPLTYGPITDFAATWAIRSSEAGLVVDIPCTLTSEPPPPGPDPTCTENDSMLQWTPFNEENDAYRILRNGRTVDRVAWDAPLSYGPVDDLGADWAIRSSESGSVVDVPCTLTSEPPPPPPAPTCDIVDGSLQWTPFNDENDNYRILLDGSTIDTVAWNVPLTYGPVDPTLDWAIRSSEAGRVVDIACVPVGPPPPPEPTPTNLTFEGSGRCITIDGASTADGANAITAGCSQAANQLFELDIQASGFALIRAQHSGKCLRVLNNSIDNAVSVVQQPCDAGVDAGLWRPVPSGSNWVLVNRHSGRCLDENEGALNAIQWTCKDSANQRLVVGGNQLDGLFAPDAGTWDSTFGLPLVPVAAALLPNGRVMTWSAYQRFNFGGANGYTQTALFDPVTGASTERTVSNTQHDMFCPGIANLPDGRILVNGGSGNAETSIYDWETGEWEDAADMNIGRGYQASLTLSDGTVMTFGGSWSGGRGGKIAEVYANGTWTTRPGITTPSFETDDPGGIFRSDNHMWLFAWTGNRVFHAGPNDQMHWIDPAGQGSVTPVGQRGSDTDAMNGSAVMYEPGKILTTGGATAYSGNTLATSNATVIDITGPTVTSRTVGSLAGPRTMHHGIVLPSGEVVIVGGQERPFLFTDRLTTQTVEIFDPDTETFTTLPGPRVPRTYHSFGLLLPDGRVAVGGGGLCGGCTTNHPDIEVFSPPYLFEPDGSRATRPVITSAPGAASYGASIAASTDRDVAEFVLIRNASATHSVNLDQRRIPLTVSGGGGSYDLTMPTDAGIAPPGYYMLFALDANGVPSESTMVRLG